MVYARIIIPIWAIYVLYAHSAAIFAARKKMEKNKNTPLRISADYDIICGVSGKQGSPPVIQKRDGTWQSVISLIVVLTAGGVDRRAWHDTR